MATLSADDITQSGQGYTNNSLCETFIKTTHAKGKGGLGEKWERGDVVGSRNCFDVGDTRTQEAIVGYDNHPQDCRVTECKDGVFGTLPKQLGTGGGNAPFVSETTAMSVDSCEDCRFYDGMNGDCKHPNHSEGEELCPVARGEDVPQYHYAVRRITPIEGERLQGFADNWTRPCFRAEDITDALCDRFCGIHQNWSAINGKPNAKPKSRKWVRDWLTKISGADCPDGPRYKAIGNSMSVNVMNWIGQRIQMEETEQ